ncbi:protein phosphatase methylesterase 1 isoform X1 [Cimex lectularius]|uniref:Protein phosphatase methylesterase 1 n=1 Tax=Cimex lectularius TaxID=79782 RepID=A0A8I6RZ31_CIMLE|nr:protein phosphatase methylesterase 1 isoform X1 [Cimex lectularius]
MSSFQKSLITRSPFLRSPGPGLPRERGKFPMVKRSSVKGRADYSPITWEKFFDEKKDLEINGNTFRVYIKGDTGPALVLIHGGGFSALSWSLLVASLDEMVECKVLAVDLRGHGDTFTTNDNELSIDVLANDVVEVINTSLPENTPVVLIGHSLGGSIAIHAGHHPNLNSLIGLVIIDVVEGTALGALSSMQNILRGRPQSFNSIEEAIRWSVQSGHLKNLDSARISMPGQIKNVVTNKSVITELETGVCTESPEAPEMNPINPAGVESISEEEEAQFKPPDKAAGKYTWRIDLRTTETHWPGWFKGLSKLFLSCQAQKLLLLASLDRLDTDLTVAQMQGKFEIHAFEQSRGRCGHAVHEDIPEAVAEVLATYLVRNKFATSKGNISGPLPCC